MLLASGRGTVARNVLNSRVVFERKMFVYIKRYHVCLLKQYICFLYCKYGLCYIMKSVHRVMRHYTGLTGIKLMVPGDYKEPSCN